MLALLRKQKPQADQPARTPKPERGRAKETRPAARRIAPDRALDLATHGRAAAIFKEEFDKWEVSILDIAKDRSLSPEQRKAAIAALRQRQKYEATTARKRYLETEKQKIRVLRRAAKAATKDTPKPPTAPRR